MEFNDVTLLIKIPKTSSVYIFFSIIVVVFANVKTYAKQFVLSRSWHSAYTGSLQGLEERKENTAA